MLANTKARQEGKFVISGLKTGTASALPKIKGVNQKYLQSRGPSELPDKEDDQITIKDLKWEDKELVLRVLFAKMNGLQKMVSGKTKIFVHICICILLYTYIIIYLNTYMMSPFSFFSTYDY